MKVLNAKQDFYKTVSGLVLRHSSYFSEVVEKLSSRTILKGQSDKMLGLKCIVET